jgi:hypothetical protein
MPVTVTSTRSLRNGDLEEIEYPTATRFELHDGHLYVFAGANLAGIYAPTTWRSADVSD